MTSLPVSNAPDRKNTLDAKEYKLASITNNLEMFSP